MPIRQGIIRTVYALLFIFIHFWPLSGNASNASVKPRSASVELIPPQGGTARLEGVVSVIFPPGAFTINQRVRITITHSRETDADFKATTELFPIRRRLPYEIRINTGNVAPLTDFKVTFILPNTFLKDLGADSKIQVFAQVFQAGGEESLDSFEPFSSALQMATRTVFATLPKDVFTDQRRDDGAFEAIVTLALLK